MSYCPCILEHPLQISIKQPQIPKYWIYKRQLWIPNNFPSALGYCMIQSYYECSGCLCRWNAIIKEYLCFTVYRRMSLIQTLYSISNLCLKQRVMGNDWLPAGFQQVGFEAPLPKGVNTQNEASRMWYVLAARVYLLWWPGRQLSRTYGTCTVSPVQLGVSPKFSLNLDLYKMTQSAVFGEMIWTNRA